MWGVTEDPDAARLAVRGILLVEAVPAAWGALPVSGGEQAWSEPALGQ